MQKVLSSAFLVLLLPTLVACDPYRQNENMGTLVGGLAGGLLGSTIGGGTGRILAIGAGAVGGALIGNSFGRSMDQNTCNDYYYPTQYYRSQGSCNGGYPNYYYYNRGYNSPYYNGPGYYTQRYTWY